MRKPHELKNKDLMRMKKLRRKGLSYREIAKRLKITHGTVQYHLSPERKQVMKEYYQAKRGSLFRRIIRAVRMEVGRWRRGGERIV